MAADKDTSPEALLALLDDLLIRQDEAGCLTYVNDAFCRIFGGTAQDWLGNAFDLDGDLIAAEGGDLPELDMVHDTPCGRRWIAWRARSLLDDDGHSQGIQAIGRDISHRKRQEETLDELRVRAEDANEAKSLFLATMSHEIRTPMNCVIGMSSLLKDSGLTAAQDTYVNAIKESGESLLSLINDILDYSKIEAGRLEFEAAPFDLMTTIHSVTELLAARCHDKGIEIGATIEPDCPTDVIGDEGRLRQVLINLLGNGVKFTDQGGVLLNVSCVQNHDGHAQIRFDVCDTGIGIPPGALESIFEEFAQADASHSREYEGTGLGLAICAKLVTAMNGQIGVESQQGQGSTFHVSLPFELTASTAATIVTDSLVGLKVLVASPSPILRQVIARSLAVPGIVIEAAPSVPDALQFLKAAQDMPFTTLICDYGLPRDGAFELSKVFAAQTAGSAARSLLLLAPEDRALLDQLKDTDFDGYLIKPVRQNSLVQRIACVHGVASTDADFEADRQAVLDERTELGVLSATRPLKILMAEDNDINALLTQTQITKMGHIVDRVTNGEDAIRALINSNFDLVLMDVRMPRLDGLEATQRIRAREDRISEVPIIALTANASEDDRKICLAAGMNDFLAKPVEASALSRVLNRWTNQTSMAKVS